jgi:hypothetical protein
VRLARRRLEGVRLRAKLRSRRVVGDLVVARLWRVLLLLGVLDALGSVLVGLGEGSVVVGGLEVAVGGFVAVVLRVSNRQHSRRLVEACDRHFGLVEVVAGSMFAAVVRSACFVEAFPVPD